MDEALVNDPRLNRVDVIGVPITATNMDDFMALLRENLDGLRGGYVCVSNVHTCVMAHDDPVYWACQAGSVASIPDGKPLSVVGRKQMPTMDRVTGPDLMREIFAISVERGWKHYFYGDRSETLEALRVKLECEYPNLDICGMEPSVFRLLTNEEKVELCARIDAAGADFCWVALGAPRQEILMSDLSSRTNCLMVGVGGAFNVLAGRIPEAPRWMQDAGLEWFYRLIQEPSRLFKRYALTNTKFIWYLLTKAKRKEI